MTHRPVCVTSLLLEDNNITLNHIIWMDYCSKQRPQHGSPASCPVWNPVLHFHFLTEAPDSPNRKLSRRKKEKRQQKNKGKSRRPSQFCVWSVQEQEHSLSSACCLWRNWATEGAGKQPWKREEAEVGGSRETHLYAEFQLASALAFCD